METAVFLLKSKEDRQDWLQKSLTVPAMSTGAMITSFGCSMSLRRERKRRTRSEARATGNETGNGERHGEQGQSETRHCDAKGRQFAAWTSPGSPDRILSLTVMTQRVFLV